MNASQHIGPGLKERAVYLLTASDVACLVNKTTEGSFKKEIAILVEIRLFPQIGSGLVPRPVCKDAEREVVVFDLAAILWSDLVLRRHLLLEPR